MITKENLIDIILKTNIGIEKDDIIIEIPKDRALGDFAMPCFGLAKKMHQNPSIIASNILEKMDKSNFDNIEIKNGYINFFLNKRKTVESIINSVLNEKDKYASSDIGNGKNIVIDYSAPNIAKPFGVGHLRSTVIGNAIKNIYKKLGYNVIGINYLGDCGTQFGKLIYAYETWGNPEEVKKNPIRELNKLYVKFHEEAEKDPSLNDEGRRIFKELEDGNPKYKEIWKWFRDESILEFKKTYDLLKINDFDVWSGESFYIEPAKDVIKELDSKHLLQISEGATIIDLGSDMAPALIKRTDGATLYITRDLAALLDRKKTYDFEEALYVVGNEQTLHFNQIKAVINKMGYDFSNQIHHIPFGLVLQDGKKMSTRKGKTVILHDVLVEAVNLASTYVKEHVSENIDEVSKMVGVGAVIFNDLKNYRTNDIDFNLQDILKFEGETGPYLQYTYARIKSLLSHKINTEINYSEIVIDEYIWNIVFKLSDFKNIIIKAKEGYDPSIIAKYLLELAGLFNKFYANVKIIDNDEINSAFRLNVAEAVSIVIKEGLRILGIETPNKM